MVRHTLIAASLSLAIVTRELWNVCVRVVQDQKENRYKMGVVGFRGFGDERCESGGRSNHKVHTSLALLLGVVMNSTE
jgi:hypothetical protein